MILWPWGAVSRGRGVSKLEYVKGQMEQKEMAVIRVPFRIFRDPPKGASISWNSCQKPWQPLHSSRKRPEDARDGRVLAVFIAENLFSGRRATGLPWRHGKTADSRSNSGSCINVPRTCSRDRSDNCGSENPDVGARQIALKRREASPLTEKRRLVDEGGWWETTSSLGSDAGGHHGGCEGDQWLLKLGQEKAHKLWTHKLFESRDNLGTTHRLTRGKSFYFLCFEANT